MDYQEIDRVAEDAAVGRITGEEAVRRLSEFIFLHPRLFSLSLYSEDFREELLAEFIDGGKRMLARYDSARGAFHTFLFSAVKGMALTLKRKEASALIDKAAGTRHEARSEGECDAQDSDDDDGFWEEGRTEGRGADDEDDGRESDGSVWMRLPDDRRGKARRKKTALVLALKSSYYIRDEGIDRVGSYCDISSAELQRVIMELNENLGGKIEKRGKIMSQRDNAYYYHRKYDAQLKFCRNDDPEKKEELERLREKKTMRWEEKNTLLRNNRFRVAPTNKMVARALGICERQVSYYIDSAKRMDRDNERLVE